MANVQLFRAYLATKAATRVVRPEATEWHVRPTVPRPRPLRKEGTTETRVEPGSRRVGISEGWGYSRLKFRAEGP